MLNLTTGVRANFMTTLMTCNLVCSQVGFPYDLSMDDITYEILDTRPFCYSCETLKSWDWLGTISFKIHVQCTPGGL